MIRDLEIILGVTGSIAVYKAVYLCRELIRRGANVHVVMTKNAMNFVTPLTFQTVTGNPVTVEMFELFQGSKIGHISLADRAHITVVAPATANILSKVANGLADDFLSTMILATKVPVLFAPAMNSVMWGNPAVCNNVRRLTETGYHFVEPATGELACGVTGQGKMAEPHHIMERIEAVLSPKDLAGEHVLVTAGPTVEPIDPVRFVSNHSSGKMGYALALAAIRRGANVTLVSGPTLLAAPVGARMIHVQTAEEMYRAVMREAPSASVVIKAAAVCDWRPSASAAEKIKKEAGQVPSLELEPTIDILNEIGKNKLAGQIFVGFAAETENLEENARRKLTGKNLDMIVANDVTQPGAGFHTDTNAVKIITADDHVIAIPLMPKDRVADRVLDTVTRYRKRTSSKT
jgi:phosphopantothenoylcysteine decarboxylase/phosphopantothenate--cysteine ligase